MIPSEGKIYAPADGTIGMVFDTLHAISLTTDFGAEVLIHVDWSTVQLKRRGGFERSCKKDRRYREKKGEICFLTVDLEKVKAAGYDIITPVLICNTADYAAVTAQADKEVNAGDDVLTVEEK
mgnify:CR=1 FL=1